MERKGRGSPSTVMLKLCRALILAFPEGTENFVTYNASHNRFGTIMIQKEKVIPYDSRQLKFHEKNNTTHNLELGDKVIQCHPRKESVVADTLSRNERAKPLRVRALVMTINSNLPPKIRKVQVESLKKENVKDRTLHGTDKEFKNRLDGTLYIRRRNKIYHNLKQFHQWPDIEASITTYVSKCLTCLKMRDDYQKPSDLPVQPKIPHWKWENIAMDFITRLPKTTSSYDTIWVIVIIKKNYANVRRNPLEFQIGNKTMLKVSPWKGVISFGKRGKLNPHYIGPLKIIARVGTVAYRLEFREQLSIVHSTFHVSKFKKCMAEEPLTIPLDEIQVDDKLKFIEEPVEIMNREVKCLKQSHISIVKVR
nr:hypothetical protein [Tanacetum cinerariifolium]